MDQTSGKIFLSEQRGVIKTGQAIKYCTFNSEGYYNEHKKPLGALKLFNDEILAGSSDLEIQVSESVYVILIPVTGDLLFQKNGGQKLQISVGQIFMSSTAAGSILTITNPFENEEINFIRTAIKSNEFGQQHTCILPIDLEGNRNKLIDLQALNINDSLKFPFRLSIGQFSGRYDLNYTMQNRSNILFSFVLAGAFEAQGRLLHPRDGLALWDIQEAEIEALSEHATLLNIELENSFLD